MVYWNWAESFVTWLCHIVLVVFLSVWVARASTFWKGSFSDFACVEIEPLQKYSDVKSYCHSALPHQRIQPKDGQMDFNAVKMKNAEYHIFEPRTHGTSGPDVCTLLHWYGTIWSGNSNRPRYDQKNHIPISTELNALIQHNIPQLINHLILQSSKLAIQYIPTNYFIRASSPNQFQ